MYTKGGDEDATFTLRRRFMELYNDIEELQAHLMIIITSFHERSGGRLHNFTPNEGERGSLGDIETSHMMCFLDGEAYSDYHGAIDEQQLRRTATEQQRSFFSFFGG